MATEESYKILVVEDNDFVRMQIVKFLQGAGHDVEESSDGSDALDRVSKDFDLAIVDVRMEPMGGFDFIRAIQGFDYDLPVILATGDNDPDMLADASNLGVGAVLMKPIDRDRLIATVGRAMAKRRKGG